MGHRRTHSAQGIPAQDPPARNDVNLNRSQLYTVLNYLASLLIVPFKGEQVTLYVHGGAVMVMHPGLVSRPTTRDVDVCLRGFDQEWEGKVKGAEQILRACIRQTATVFHLGADWMNSDPDVALPWAFE